VEVGVGKSRLAQALCHCAIRQGIDVRFSSCTQLATLARVSVLIVDDFGLKPLRPPADEDIHDLIAECYERTSTIVTSNLDFADWDQAFPNNRLLASFTIDRLRHNAYCIEPEDPSRRNPKVTPPSKSRLANCQKSAHS